MRADQLQRLQDLSEKLADAFLVEADPGEWSGDGKLPGDLTQQERGDRYWCKKNAMATGGVLKFTIDILAKQAPADGGEGVTPEEESDLDRQIKEAEKRSRELVDAAVSRAKRKPEFDKRVGGQ